MNDDANKVVELTAVPTEIEGAMIVAALDARGVKAQMTGALTSGFRAETPSGVQIVVRCEDLEQAQTILLAMAKEADQEADRE